MWIGWAVAEKIELLFQKWQKELSSFYENFDISSTVSFYEPGQKHSYPSCVRLGMGRSSEIKDEQEEQAKQEKEEGKTKKRK